MGGKHPAPAQPFLCCLTWIAAALLAMLALPTAAEVARMPAPAPTVATSGPPQPAAPPPFNRALTETVLREVLTALRDRYIEPVSLPDLAFRAATGLGSLAPEISVRRGDGEWRLAADGRALGSWREPAAADAQGWAGMLAAMAAAAATAPGLRGTSEPQMLMALSEPLSAALDPYTRYVPPAEASAAQGRRRGESGIGVRAVPAADGAAIVEVLEDSPADHAGLSEGDRIIAVDGVRLRGLSEPAIAAMLAGDEDTRIVLSVRQGRGAALRQVAIIRALVVPPSVHWERRGDVAMFRVSTFNRLTDQHLARALLDAQAGTVPLRGIVLDLRGNRGGLLRQAVAVVDLFVAQGEIAATRGRHPDAARTYVAAGADLAARLPLLVLVDGSSASAAEIVAASLQARGRAAAVGSSTLGKGLVQTVIRLPDGGELVLTWSRVLIPPGVALNGIGVVPVLCTVPGRETVPARILALHNGTVPDWLRAWHRAGGAGPGRAELLAAREACPPRDGGPEDLEAALALLADPAALANALGQPPAASTVRPPRPPRLIAGAN
ncbi:MAG: PDZ domain-containing protein [Acetobacteraceae bacterium]|nr:PDZ domain-containing protein [Acetobacteraceae bacterium]